MVDFSWCVHYNLKMTTLTDLQNLIGETNEKSGFNEFNNIPEEHQLHYLGSKLMLVAGELGEAQEEIRAGHGINETYYTLTIPSDRFEDADEAEDIIGQMIEEGHVGKPEGFPVELADAVIRIFGIAYEAGIDLPAAIEEKLAYNATREFKHGKQF